MSPTRDRPYDIVVFGATGTYGIFPRNSARFGRGFLGWLTCRTTTPNAAHSLASCTHPPRYTGKRIAMELLLGGFVESEGGTIALAGRRADALESVKSA
jgi:hypothetical protein